MRYRGRRRARAGPRSRPGDPGTLVGVAGTVTSLAAMAEALVSYDPARVHGYRLSQEALAEQIARLRVGTQAAREGSSASIPDAPT